MSIRNRPYTITRMALQSQEKLNECYDKGIDDFHSAVYETLRPRPPLRLSVTNRCNLSCTYCYDKEGQPPFQQSEDMDPAIVSKIFEKYPNPSSVLILGGEPFLNIPAVEAILDHYQGIVSISTNGQVANDQVDHLLHKIVERNKDGKPTVLQVSSELGGFTNERNTRNAEEILTHFVPICGACLIVKYTMTQPDVANIKKIVRWYWDRKLCVQFDYADGGSGSGIPVDLPDEDRITIFEFALEALRNSFADWLQDESDSWPIIRVRSLLDRVFTKTLTQLEDQNPIWSSCGILGHSIYVGPKGELYPCHRWKYAGQSYGALGEDMTGKVEQFHREVGPRTKDYCHGCIWRGGCGGICPAVVCNYGGKSLEGRCKFIGALRDAVWSFLADEQILSHPRIDEYIEKAIQYRAFQT